MESHNDTFMRQQGWLDTLESRLTVFAKSPFFSANPVLQLALNDGYQVNWIRCSANGPNGPIELSLDHFQLSLIEGSDGTYPQFITSREYHHGGHPAMRVPLFSTIETARAELEKIRLRELAMIEKRQTDNSDSCENPLIALYLGFSDAEVAATGSVRQLLLRHDDGGSIEALRRTFRTLHGDRDGPLWCSDPDELATLASLNVTINKYWLSHLLIGDYYYYRSRNAVDAALHNSLSDLLRVAWWDEALPSEPTIYIVVCRPIDGINPKIAFANEALRRVLTYGLDIITTRGPFMWKLHEVKPEGTPYVFCGRMLEISDPLVQRYSALASIRKCINRMEHELPFAAEAKRSAKAVPLIAVVPYPVTLTTFGVQPIDVLAEECGRLTRNIIVCPRVSELFSAC